MLERVVANSETQDEKYSYGSRAFDGPPRRPCCCGIFTEQHVAGTNGRSRISGRIEPAARNACNGGTGHSAEACSCEQLRRFLVFCKRLAVDCRTVRQSLRFLLRNRNGGFPIRLWGSDGNQA